MYIIYLATTDLYYADEISGLASDIRSACWFEDFDTALLVATCRYEDEVCAEIHKVEIRSHKVTS